MPLNTAAKLLEVLGKLPPDAFRFIADAIMAVAGSRDKYEAARKLKAAASKELTEQALAQALAKVAR